MKRLALRIGAVALAAALAHSLRRRRAGSGDVVRAYFDAWSEGDGDAIRDLVTDDYLAHVHTLEGMEERDADELVDIVGGHAKAFAEVEYELQELLCTTGTPQCEPRCARATGKRNEKEK